MNTCRVILHCEQTLPAMLVPFLESDSELVVAGTEQEVHMALESAEATVVLLELSGDLCELERQIAFGDELVAGGRVVLVMAGDGDRSAAMELVRRGAFGLVRKPPALRELKVLIRRAYGFAVSNQKRRGIPTQSGRDRLVGSSLAMQTVYQLIDSVANINASVLITGESGTGKELVARAIHNLSSRAGRPFVAVSCGAIPETLMEAELFGHEKGAFTGTVSSRLGYLEQAGDGTLFLDEIGELSPATQVKLLRVLAQREFSRLGNNRVIPLQARVLFATHRNLGQMVETGEFRRDLYYRVNVLSIPCPALREHIEDIGPLAEHLVQQYANQFGKPVLGIDSEALAVMREHDWPGNVRELENVIQRAVIVARHEQITLADLPESLRQEESLLEHSRLAILPSGGSFETKLQQYKVRLATQAIANCGGNKTLAAKQLDISRAYLHRLIRETAEPSATASDVA